MKVHSKQRNAVLPFKSPETVRTLTCSKFERAKCHEETQKSMRIGKYIVHLDEVLGKGYSSKVYKGTEEGKRNLTRYAIKVIDLKHFSASCVRMFEREMEIHRSLKHDHIVRCHEVYKTGSHIYMVMEYCPHGDLAAFIKQKKKLAEPMIVDVMTQILSGYRYLARQGIIHRDLKPPNIMRSGKIWKIADFGFSVRSAAFTDEVNVGTPLYMPLQALAGSYYSAKSDIYALGVILYEMLHGRTPWTCKSQKELLRRMSRQRVVVSQEVQNEKIKEFILKCCSHDEEQRLSQSELDHFDFNQAPPHSRQLSKYVQPNPLFFHSCSYKLKEIDADCAHTESNCNILRGELQHCHFVYSLSSNIESFMLPAEEKKVLQMVLLEYLLKLIKTLEDGRFNSRRLLKFDEFKTTEAYNLMQRQINDYAASYEKAYLDFIKNTDVKTIRLVNQRFKEFTVTGRPLTTQFYLDFWNYLLPIVKKTDCLLNNIISDDGEPEDQSLPQKLESFQNLMILLKTVQSKAKGQNINLALGVRQQSAKSRLTKSDFLNLRKEAAYL